MEIVFNGIVVIEQINNNENGGVQTTKMQISIDKTTISTKNKITRTATTTSYNTRQSLTIINVLDSPVKSPNLE